MRWSSRQRTRYILRMNYHVRRKLTCISKAHTDAGGPLFYPRTSLFLNHQSRVEINLILIDIELSGNMHIGDANTFCMNVKTVNHLTNAITG